MLVLNRKLGERIVIGHGITISVVRMSGRRVTLSVDAPADVPVRRGELIEVESSFLQPISRPTAAAT